MTTIARRLERLRTEYRAWEAARTHESAAACGPDAEFAELARASNEAADTFLMTLSQTLDEDHPAQHYSLSGMLLDPNVIQEVDTPD